MNTTIARRALVFAVLTLLGTSYATRSDQGEQDETIAGLGLGLLSSEMRLAATGGVFEYDGSRQAERTGTKAREIADSEASGATADETVGEVGHRHLQDLLGDWKIDIWVRAVDGQRTTASGTARVTQADENSVRIQYRDIATADDTGKLQGHAVISYNPGREFELESSFDTTDEVGKFVGEYLANRNAYYFYLMSKTGEPVNGVMHSIVRVKLRISSPALWVAETYTFVEGEEVQVQSYRFSRS
jgi:hypothetical protein